MRLIRGVLALLVVVPLVLALAIPAAAGGGHPGHAVPLRLHLSGLDRPLDMAPGTPPFLELSTFGGRCSQPSTWVTTIDSAGTAEHLGRVTVLQTHCTRFDFFAPVPQPATLADGRMLVTAANGDELWIHYGGSFLFYPGATPDVGTSMITYGPMTIVGGTGRFDGATGTLSGSAADHFPDGPNEATFSGSIVYDASAVAGH